MLEPHRTLEKPGEGIVRDQEPTQQHQEYPKLMRHPAYRPGKAAEEVKVGKWQTTFVGGEPIRYPPVLAMNADQAAMHEAEGYIDMGKSDPAAFARAIASEVPSMEPHVAVEYPKWIASVGKVANSAEHEAELLGDGPVAAPVPAETSKPYIPAAPPPDTRVDALEAKVDRMEGTMERIAALLERSLAPADDVPVKQAATKVADATSRSEKIKAGLARKKAAKATEATNPAA